MNTRRRSTRTKTGTTQTKTEKSKAAEHKTEDTNVWWGVVNGPMKSYLTVIGDGLDVPKNVYEDLKLTIDDIEFLSDETRQVYLPETKDPVTINIVPSNCSSADLPQFSSLRLSSYISNHTGMIINVGFSIWGLQWCPSLPTRSPQYLAVGGYKSTTDEHREIGIKQTTNMQNVIQIWRIDCRDEKEINGEERDLPYLDMVICHDYGCVYDLKWCPYGACELVDNDIEENDGDNTKTHIKRLGILAGCFGDGTVRFFVIPSPDDIRRRLGKNDAETLYIKFKQEVIKLSLPGILCWTLEWGGHEKVAVGCTNGYIATWNMYDIFSKRNQQQSISNSNLLCPTRYVWSHDSSVRQVLWNSHFNPTHILSCGHDGKVQIFDERDPCMKYDLRHLRTVMMSVAWSNRYDGLMFPDQEYGVRFVRTDDFAKTMRVLQHRQCIWSIGVSLFHPFVASCGTDGLVTMTNIFPLKSNWKKPKEVILYRLSYNSESRSFTIWDNIIPRNETKLGRNESLYNYLFPPEISIQKLQWNPNITTGTWIASGGAAGLLRVECADKNEE